MTIKIHRNEAELAGKNIVKANIQARIKIVTGDTLQVIPTLIGQFNFVFIDTEKSEYFRYFKLAEDKLRKGAVVFADNAGIFADQMSDYLDYIRNLGKYQSRFVQVDEDGVEISVRL